MPLGIASRTPNESGAEQLARGCGSPSGPSCAPHPDEIVIAVIIADVVYSLEFRKAARFHHQQTESKSLLDSSLLSVPTHVIPSFTGTGKATTPWLKDFWL